MVSADNTAAAGAHGAEIKRCVPPKVAAIKPKAVTPNMPANAPLAPNSAPNGEKMVTPNAMADGSATNMAAKPPQISPDRLARESVCDVDMANMTVFCQYRKIRNTRNPLDLSQAITCL
jgi:hypothetical protein